MHLLANITDKHSNGMLIPTRSPAHHHFRFRWRVLLTRCDGFQVIKGPLLLKLGKWVSAPPLVGPSWAGRHSCSARAAETRFMLWTGSTAGEPRLVYAFIPNKTEILISFSSAGEQEFYYRHIGNHSAGISESGNYCFLRIPQTRLYIKPGCSAHIFSPSLTDGCPRSLLPLTTFSITPSKVWFPSVE